MSSLSQVIVTQLKDLKPHENADNLLVGSFDGMPFIVNKNDSRDGDLRCIVPFDVICPNAPWIGEFIRGQRVKPMRLRGVFSMAVCLPLPEGCEATEGEDVTERLGFTKWEPVEIEERDGVELQSTGSGRECSAPSGLTLYKYDLESLRKYHKEFIEGETVVITEKIEGENISVVYWDGHLHVKSRNRWIAEGDNKWWRAVHNHGWNFLRENPGLVAIGEKYGNVNKFRYDCVNGEQKIRLFDVYNAVKGEFLNFEDAVSVGATNDWVPMLYIGPWRGLEAHKHLAEGNTSIKHAGHLREGFVVQPLQERQTRSFDRVKYKLHGEAYMIAKGKMK